MRVLNFILLMTALTLVSCSKDEDDKIATPSTYEFTRDGATSVSYSGQTDRLNMVAAIKTYLGTGDKKEAALSAATLNAAYSNEGGNGNGFYSFESSKQLENKTFADDVNFYKSLFNKAEMISANPVDAANGNAGYLTREGGNSIMVDEKGREITQLVEKGMMGSIFYNQIYNSYLTDAKIGNDIENTNVSEGKNYTAMEHHWDEAYGYFDAPVDFKSSYTGSGTLRFWAKYANTVDAHTGSNSKIMDAFLKGRTAIINKDYTEKNAQRDVLYTELEIVAAATAIHYINSTLAKYSANEPVNAIHALSEAWAFTNALKYSPNRKITVDQINTILNTDFGTDGNFWTATAEGLNTAKNTLATIYPSLASIKDEL